MIESQKVWDPADGKLLEDFEYSSKMIDLCCSEITLVAMLRINV